MDKKDAQSDLHAEHLLENELVTWLAQTSSRESEEPFFNKLARYLAQCLGMDFVCIDTLEGDGLTARTMAVWADGRFEDNLAYALKDTPCGAAVGKTVCCFPAAVCQLFPGDPVLQQLRAESYVGVTLWNRAGTPIGLIAVISRYPLVNRRQTESLMQLVAERASAELERLIADEALLERELELEQTQLLAGTGSWTYCPVRRKYWCSKGMFHIWGVDPAPGVFPSIDHRKHIHPADYPRFESALKEAVEQGRPFNLELRITRPDGEQRIIVDVCEPLLDGDGKVVKLRGSNQDITERRKADDRLRESGEYLRFFFEYAPAALAMFDHNMCYLHVSNRWRSDYGLGERALLGVSHYQIFPEIPEKWKEAHRRGLAGEVIREEEERFERADGSLQWLCWEIRPWNKSDGTVGGIVIFTEDITARKRTEEALRKSETEFRMLAESMPQIVWICAPDGRNIYFNQQWVDYTGLSLEESYGHGWNRPFHPDDQVRAWEAWQDATRNGTTYALECRLRGADGIYKWWLIRGLPLLDQEGTILKWFGTCTDIDELKKGEEEKLLLEQKFQQTQKLESLGVLAGGIAHDFNNILMVILGNADLALMRLGKESPAIENLHNIERAAARASDLSKQMLAYSGKGRFVVENLNLNSLLEEMLHMLQVSISKKAVLRFNFAPRIPSVAVDATQLRQIVMNLVINASEAIDDKSGVIAISTGCMECDKNYLKDVWLNEDLDEGMYVYLEVADTGCGMDNETLSKIFDPFFTTKFTGRGLGMAAVLGIVKGHKGAIKVYSEPGRGTTFKILLPASDRPADLSSSVSHTADWQGSGTVLLVDDEESVRGTGSEMLRELGFSPITANDGREAIGIFKETPGIAFVILDLTMPHMDGEQCFRELRQLQPDLKVIMTSGYNEQEVTQKFAGKGLAAFIQKPYKLSMLREVIRGMGKSR